MLSQFYYSLSTEQHDRMDHNKVNCVEKNKKIKSKSQRIILAFKSYIFFSWYHGCESFVFAFSQENKYSNCTISGKIKLSRVMCG